MVLLKNALLISLVLATAAMAGTWEHDLAVADSLFTNGYYEAAIDDYQKLVTSFPDQVPVVDRAWFGMARCYKVLGNVDGTKVALEKVLERDLDPTATDGARVVYREMKREAELRKNEAEQAKNFYEMRYEQTSWLNIITKVFDWFDRRKSRKVFDEAAAVDATYNPRYLIDPVTPVAVATDTADHFTLTADEMQKLLDAAAAANAKTDIDDLSTDAGVIGDDTAAATIDATVGADASMPVTVSPSTDLKECRDAYLTAYRALQDALRDKNQLAIQQANESFQKALAQYKAAQAAVAAAQSR